MSVGGGAETQASEEGVGVHCHGFGLEPIFEEKEVRRGREAGEVEGVLNQVEEAQSL